MSWSVKPFWGGSLFVATAVAAADWQLGTTARSGRGNRPALRLAWSGFYYYPYVYYPHNFSAPVQYDNLYYRYPQERQIPVYNTSWYNFYPTEKPYYKGHHFILDVF